MKFIKDLRRKPLVPGLHASDAFNFGFRLWPLPVWVNPQMRKGNGAMGRCGGGWLGKVGLDIGRTEIIVYLFWPYVRVSFKRPRWDQYEEPREDNEGGDRGD